MRRSSAYNGNAPSGAGTSGHLPSPVELAPAVVNRPILMLPEAPEVDGESPDAASPDTSAK